MPHEFVGNREDVWSHELLGCHEVGAVVTFLGAAISIGLAIILGAVSLAVVTANLGVARLSCRTFGFGLVSLVGLSAVSFADLTKKFVAMITSMTILCLPRSIAIATIVGVVTLNNPATYFQLVVMLVPTVSFGLIVGVLSIHSLY